MGCGEQQCRQVSAAGCKTDCTQMVVSTIEMVKKQANMFVNGAHSPSRIYIPHDVAELTMVLSRYGGRVIADPAEISIAVTKKKKCLPEGEELAISVWACKILEESGKAHFEISGEFYTDPEKFPAGLYIGVLMIGECHVDTIEIVKAPTIGISGSARIHTEVCDPGTDWVEPACLEPKEKDPQGDIDDDNCSSPCGAVTEVIGIIPSNLPPSDPTQGTGPIDPGPSGAPPGGLGCAAGGCEADCEPGPTKKCDVVKMKITNLPPVDEAGGECE